MKVRNENDHGSNYIYCDDHSSLTSTTAQFKYEFSHVIFQTRARVLYRGFQTRQNWWKPGAVGWGLLLFLSVWKTPVKHEARVFEMASQSAPNSANNRKKENKRTEERKIHKHVILPSFVYTRFQCYVHRRHLRLSFDMPSFDRLCNLAHIKMLTQRTLSRSNSTFSQKRWIYLTSKLRFGVSRSHSVGEKSTALNVYIFRI